MPKVSVVIPTHNRAELLPLAVRSVLEQTFQDFEIIIVDDASKDNTKEVVQGFKDDRIKFLHRDTCGGDAVARNLGIAISKGEYIALLDDDDQWAPEKLEQQVNIFLNSLPNVGAVYTGRVNIDGKTGEMLDVILAKKKGFLFDEFLNHFFITTSSVMLRKECFNKVGLFDENIPYNSDFDMWIRVSKDFQFGCIEEPLTRYFIHQKTLSSNFDLVIKGKEKILEKYAQWYVKHPKSFSREFLEIGILYCLNGNPEEGRKAYLRAVLLDPFRIKPYLILVLSSLGTNVFRKVTKLWNVLPKLSSLSQR